MLLTGTASTTMAGKGFTNDERLWVIEQEPRSNKKANSDLKEKQ